MLGRKTFMKTSKTIGLALLLLTLLSANNAVHNKSLLAIPDSYSTGFIAEVGEASTVLVYSQIDATVKVYVPDYYWQPTTDYLLVPVSMGIAGSGFFVNSNGYIATAGHVIFSFTHSDITQDLYTKYYIIYNAFNVLLQALEDAGYTFTPDEETTLLNYIQSYGVLQDSIRVVYAVLGEVKSTLTEVQAKGWVARVVSVSPYIERDLALLKIEGFTNCPVLTVADSDQVKTGDSTYMFGFPDITSDQFPSVETLLAPTMTGGIISAKRLTNFQTPCFQTDATITHGMSGGPGLNANGEVTGITSRGSISETGQEAAGFNFLVQSNVLKSLLTESNVANTKGPIDTAFLTGLDYFYGKHYSAAKAQFETVIGLFPYHWRAEELILESNAAIARGEDVALTQGIETWALIAAILAGAAIVAVVAIIIVQRRRPQSAVSE
jgi:S1-C subfamily serine protease